MGRQIRRVPPDWQHPKNERCTHIGWKGKEPHNGDPCYKPLHDSDYESAAAKWEMDYVEFMAMGADARAKRYYGTAHYWEYAHPPDREYHRTWRWTSEAATAYQVYETVSEGTPISPVFETVEQLRAWLLSEGHSERAVDEFIRGGWAPSMVIFDGHVVSGIDAFDVMPST